MDITVVVLTNDSFSFEVVCTCPGHSLIKRLKATSYMYLIVYSVENTAPSLALLVVI